ncbi:MAG: hypothetical protein CM15mP83_0760 [Flavobacteriaceae bacterium]|nr:MAG: hypothetical protein CM15mP83_0760 [Flavobacteriaceae bacterium]
MELEKPPSFSLLLDLIQATAGTVKSMISLCILLRIGRKNSCFFRRQFLIGYLTPEEYFYFIGELRGVSKEEVDELLTGYTDFFNDEILNKNKYIRDLSKEIRRK